MFCSRCGAAVAGNYCSVCGQKIRTPLAEFRVEEHRRKKAFMSEMCALTDIPSQHLADACWAAGSTKYTNVNAVCGRSVGEIRPNAYANLEKAEALARRLYFSLCDLLRTD